MRGDLTHSTPTNASVGDLICTNNYASKIQHDDPKLATNYAL